MSYSDEELHRMLAVERLVLSQQLRRLKREISERVAQIEHIERRLAHIEKMDRDEDPTGPISRGAAAAQWTALRRKATEV